MTKTIEEIKIEIETAIVERNKAMFVDRYEDFRKLYEALDDEEKKKHHDWEEEILVKVKELIDSKEWEEIKNNIKVRKRKIDKAVKDDNIKWLAEEAIRIDNVIISARKTYREYIPKPEIFRVEITEAKDIIDFEELIRVYLEMELEIPEFPLTTLVAMEEEELRDIKIEKEKVVRRKKIVACALCERALQLERQTHVRTPEGEYYCLTCYRRLEEEAERELEKEPFIIFGKPVICEYCDTSIMMSDDRIPICPKGRIGDPELNPDCVWVHADHFSLYKESLKSSI